MYKTLLAMFLVLAACADIPEGETEEEIEEIEQSSCVTPCRVIPHKIFMAPDFFDSRWVAGGSGGTTGVNTGTWWYAQNGGGRQVYSLPTLQILRAGAFTACTASGSSGSCDGTSFTCPHHSLVKVTEPSFKQYCGDKYGLTGPGYDCGSSPYGSNYNWNPPGSATIDHRWDIVGGQILTVSGSAATASVTSVPGQPTKKTLACTYPADWGLFSIDAI